MDISKSHDISGKSVDELVIKGLNYIKKNGERVSARGLSGLQVYNINYILKNPKRRVHTLRAPSSVRYLAREILAFFNGSLKAEEMAKTSKFWWTIADKEGKITSNYGYYVFHQLTPEGKSQYEWVINLLQKDKQSRQAIININQIIHKKSYIRDVPCNIAMHFFIQKNYLSCIVSSRSTDIITGLPYNMGFFSLITELVWKDLKERGLKSLKLGYCTIKSNLTQLYDDRLKWAEEVEANKNKKINPKLRQMPPISSAKELLKDIYTGGKKSHMVKWCIANSILK
jgi:thymidylate synthase